MAHFYSGLFFGVYVEWIKDIRKISQPFTIQAMNPLVHNLLNILCLMILILLFLSFSALASMLEPLKVIFSTFGLTFVFFSLFTLVVHESSHNMFLVTKNINLKRKLNRFFAYPITAISFQDYKTSWEIGHIQHHKDPINKNDPQNCPEFCLQGRQLIIAVAKVIFIPGFAADFQSRCIKSKKSYYKGMFYGLLFWIPMAITNYFIFNLWVTLIQLIAINLTMVINLLKVSMEHSGGLKDEVLPELRSKSSFFIGRNLIIPFNVSIHFEHHLVMNIPWYNLKSFHKEAYKIVPEDMRKKVYNLNTKEVIQKLSGKES